MKIKSAGCVYLFKLTFTVHSNVPLELIDSQKETVHGLVYLTLATCYITASQDFVLSGLRTTTLIVLMEICLAVVC